MPSLRGEPSLWTHGIGYLRDVARHWVTLAAGAVTAVIGFIAAVTSTVLPAWVWWLLALTFLSIAQFRAYLDTRRSLDDLDALHTRSERRQQAMRASGDLVDETLHPMELLALDARPLVEYRTFRNCTFTGPAVVSFVMDTELISCTFNNEGGLYEVPQGSFVRGVIGFMGCRFERCTFGPGIAFVGSEEQLGMIRNLPRI